MFCACALDGIDNGERCISLHTWHENACTLRSPHVQVGMREVAVVVGSSRTCGEIPADTLAGGSAIHMWGKGCYLSRCNRVLKSC